MSEPAPLPATGPSWSKESRDQEILSGRPMTSTRAWIRSKSAFLGQFQESNFPCPFYPTGRTREENREAWQSRRQGFEIYGKLRSSNNNQHLVAGKPPPIICADEPPPSIGPVEGAPEGRRP
jgi:hypothetical protein